MIRLLAFILCCSTALAQLPVLSAYKKPVVSGGGTPAISHVWSNTSPSSATVNVTVAPSSGNLLVVCATSGTGDISSLSDNVESATGWTKAISTNYQAGTSKQYVAIWYKKNIPSGITTVTSVAANDAPTTFVYECTGCSASAPFTSTEHAQFSTGTDQTTSNPQVGGLSNGTANSIYFAVLGDFEGAASCTMTINSTGTTGTWNIYNNVKMLDGSNFWPMSVVNIVVSSSSSRTHGWATTTTDSCAVSACFH